MTVIYNKRVFQHWTPNTLNHIAKSCNTYIPSVLSQIRGSQISTKNENPATNPPQYPHKHNIPVQHTLHRHTYPKITAFHSIILLSVGAPLTPAGGSSCSLNIGKYVITLFNAHYFVPFKISH